jgi:hypothetical protein
VTWVKLTILSTALANSSLLFLIIPTLASALLPWIDNMVASPQRGSGDQVSLMKSPQEEGGGGGAEGGEGTGTELRPSLGTRKDETILGEDEISTL